MHLSVGVKHRGLKSYLHGLNSNGTNRPVLVSVICRIDQCCIFMEIKHSWDVFQLIYISNEDCVTIDSKKYVPVHITGALFLMCNSAIDINICYVWCWCTICYSYGTCWGCTYIYFWIIALTTRQSYHFHMSVEEPRTIQLVSNQNTKDENLLPWY